VLFRSEGIALYTTKAAVNHPCSIWGAECELFCFLSKVVDALPEWRNNHLR